MNTYELTSLLNRAPQLKHLHGQVCAKDLLPKEKPLDVKAYVINTDTSDKPGEHWVAIYFRNNNEAIYFDSYGLPPLEDYILPFIQRNARHWIYNNELLQSPWSRVCGMYCINILDQLGRGLDLKTAIHEQLYGTGEDPYQNDRYVEMWFSLNYGQLYKDIYRGITPLWKPRVQFCECLKYTHCLSQKFPMYTMLC